MIGRKQMRMGRCYVELKFPSTVTMGGNGYKLSAQRLLGSFGWALMIGFVNGCLENHLPSKSNACCPKDPIFTAPKAGLYLGTRLLLLPAITKLGRKLDQNSSPKKVPGCNRKQHRSSLKRKFKMAK